MCIGTMCRYRADVGSTAGAQISYHGFTLVEMLVVIAIIGILASLLMPSLMKSLEMARAVSCANNLKQIGVSSGDYANEYNGFFPAGQAPAKPGYMPLFWFDGLNIGGMLQLPWLPYRTGNTGLNSLVAGTIINCPSLSPVNFYAAGYGKNTTVAGGGNNLSQPDNLLRIATPSTRFLVLDGGNWCLNYWSYGSGQIDFIRHAYFNNALFVDFHVEKVTIADNLQTYWQ